MGYWIKAEFINYLAVRPAIVGNNNDFTILVEEVLDSGKGEADAGVVGNLDFVVNLNKGNVIVNAEEYSFILDVNARQRFEIHTGD